MTINPWDIQPVSEPDLTNIQTYTAVGEALSAWESVEVYFARLFGFFCARNDTFVSERAYGGIASFTGRHDLLTYAAEAYFHEQFNPHKMMARFYSLLQQAKNFSARRNEIAHGRVIGVVLKTPRLPGEHVADHFKRNRRYLLVPPEYNTKKNRLVPLQEPDFVPGRKEGRYSYSSQEINHYRDHFKKLEQAVDDLMEDWWNEYPDEAPTPPY